MLDAVPSVVAAAHDHGGGASGATQAVQTLERPDLFVFGLIGLLAGAHCLGMCGPLVTTYGDRMREARSGRNRDELTPFEVRQHLLFNLGRTAGYALVGGLFGLLGALAFVSVDAAAALAPTNAHLKRDPFDARVVVAGDPTASRLFERVVPLSTPESGAEANRLVTALSSDSGKGPWWRRPMAFDPDATAVLLNRIERV
ncbi:MAG: sulfite exporter TauE/SafE family protein [Halorubrum sp.]